MSDARTAELALIGHRYYAYRSCAPDPERPGMAAGADLPLDAWGAPDLDGAEDQRERRAREAAALAVCGTCPVRQACAAWATSEDADGHLAAPEGIVGGTRSLTRLRGLIRSRHAALNGQPAIAEAIDPKVVRKAGTPQKRAVLRALAQFTNAHDVAGWAGMDVRTANWQRSVLAGLFGLDKDTATRGQLLDAAAAAGLLDDVTVVPCDGTVPAAPATEGLLGPRESFAAVQPTLPESARPAPAALDTQPAPGQDAEPAAAEPEPQPAVRIRRLPTPARTRYSAIPGQLQLELDPPARPTLRLVPALPDTITRLESVA